MNEKNFINFHVLISHSPSCLNRDDMNMQKSAIFGGQRRVRISSQSLKRAMRKSDYYAAHLGQCSTRSIHLDALRTTFVEALSDRYPEALVLKAIEWIAGKEAKVETNDAVAPWTIGEVAWFCDQIEAGEEERLGPKKLQKQIEKASLPFRQALGQCVDIALSGRMATSGLMSEIGKVDGAMSLAHTITTHSVDADVDWFTAMDDLQELGSGHLNTQEFSSGVFYRYASLNIHQLRRNLGDADRARALEIGGHLLHMLAAIVPSAKQQSFAAHNLADCALVSFSDIPISLANAFEAPVKAGRGGYLTPSIDALFEYWGKIHRGYGVDEQTAAFLLEERGAMDDLLTFGALSDLKNWLLRDAGE